MVAPRSGLVSGRGGEFTGVAPAVRPPCGRRLLLRCRYLRFCAAPLGAFICTILLARPPRAVPHPAPLLLTYLWCLVWPRPLRSCSAVVFIVIVVLISASYSLLVRPSPFLLLLPHPTLPPLPYLGLLRPLTPPRAPLPPALAADISRKDKDVGDRTSWVVARWLVAGGSAPRGKSPSIPLDVVGDSTSRPQFLHRPQQ